MQDTVTASRKMRAKSLTVSASSGMALRESSGTGKLLGKPKIEKSLKKRPSNDSDYCLCTYGVQYMGQSTASPVGSIVWEWQVKGPVWRNFKLHFGGI